MKEKNGIVDYGRDQILMGDEEWWPEEVQAGPRAGLFGWPSELGLINLLKGWGLK